MGGSAMTSQTTFSTVTGYFMQDDPNTDAESFDFQSANFGLIDRDYDSDDDDDRARAGKTQWERFAEHVRHLNEQSPQSIAYKVLYLGRHGEGDHNVAEAQYGTPLWDEYWSKQPGNDKLNWTDAHLTEQGRAQALDVNRFWREALAVAKTPAPESYYTSPLARCLETARLSFTGLHLAGAAPFTPTVKELLREVNGEHTCDKRSSRTWIAEHYPAYAIENGFAEGDELWTPAQRESHAHVVARLADLLRDVFEHDRGSTFVSLTSHSGAIAGALEAVGHREFRLATGAVIPVLVKAVRAADQRRTR